MNCLKCHNFQYGLKRGAPIMIGYIPVSFAFGLMAVSNGIPPWLAIFISFSNLTSAGQFAGTNLIIANASYYEITLTTFIINIRYMLMSLSLSQRLDQHVTMGERFLFSFGITDETFAVASSEEMPLTCSYMLGLISGPIFGWSLGTALGALICSALPASLTASLGIALYGMFIAIIIPPCKHSLPIVFVVTCSCILSCILRYVPIFSFISSGFRTIIVTLSISGFAAILFPLKETDSDSNS